ncbi:hypothetical protein [Actinoplanes xinjiangensis]|uniref:hypothetical protein n=1 Tax=Actinoplanes xinjiangensis TaxID=512350 RepID=UPI00342C6CFC
MLITVVDAATGVPVGRERTIELVEETMCLDELIRRYTLLGIAGSDRGADPADQTRLALDAFGRNAFVVLVDDRQVTDLTETVRLREGSRVTFLKLVLLAGG